MRIGGGALRGRTVRVAEGVRPTGGRAREALFDIWSTRLAGRRLLDLFAGSGAVGIEALSRGAAFCLAVERSASVARVLRANYENLLPEGAWRILTRPLPGALGSAGLVRSAPFDLVFADPPYAHTAWVELLAGLGPLLARGGEVALEHGRRNRPPEASGGLIRDAMRAYGETELSFYLPSEEPLPGIRPR